MSRASFGDSDYRNEGGQNLTLGQVDSTRRRLMASGIVKVEYKGDPPEIHCPVCGMAVFEMERNGQVCKHVLFTYVDLAGSFGSVSNRLKEDAETAVAFAEGNDLSPVEVLMLMLDRPSTFCLAVSTSGMACGPVGGTASVGFDFSPEQDE